MFKAIKELHREKLQNPIVHDAKGKSIGSRQEIHNTVRDHFQEHFNDKSVTEEILVETYEMSNPITTDEVKKSVATLSNGKAPGYDNITVELIKYGPDCLYQHIQRVLVDCVENGTDIECGKGMLAPIPKPGKPKGPVTNLRPVTLLPIIRKILSNIVHTRIKPSLKQYLSPSQSAYREGRCTGDIIWAYRWMIAKAQTVKERIYVTGIDLSSAFDTIDRHKLIHLLKQIVGPDEVQMIKVLLRDTTLTIKMKDVIADPFTTNVGSPQEKNLNYACMFLMLKLFFHMRNRVRNLKLIMRSFSRTRM